MEWNIPGAEECYGIFCRRAYTIYVDAHGTYSPDVTLCGWLGSKYQLTNCRRHIPSPAPVYADVHGTYCRNRQSKKIKLRGDDDDDNDDNILMIFIVL